MEQSKFELVEKSGKKTVVVGAGPVGSLAALYAATRGDEVEVYELRGGKQCLFLEIHDTYVHYVPNASVMVRPLKAFGKIFNFCSGVPSCFLWLALHCLCLKARLLL